MGAAFSKKKKNLDTFISCCLTNMPILALLAHFRGIEAIRISTKTYSVSKQFTGLFMRLSIKS